MCFKEFNGRSCSCCQLLWHCEKQKKTNSFFFGYHQYSYEPPIFLWKRDFAEILVLSHSVPHLILRIHEKNSKVPTHLTFSRKKSFFEKLAVSRNICSFFLMLFLKLQRFQCFSPLQNFFDLNDFFFVPFLELLLFGSFLSIFLIWSSKGFHLKISCKWQKKVEKRIHWLEILPSIHKIVQKISKKLKTFS